MQVDPAIMEAEIVLMEMLVSTVFFSLLAAVSIRDIWYRDIPDRLQAGIVITACLRMLLLKVSPYYVLGGFILVPYLVAALCGKEGKGIGGGDIKLAGSSGMVLGLQGAVSASLIGLVLFLGYVYLQKRADGKEKGFPLCPFLCFGASVSYCLQTGGLMR